MATSDVLGALESIGRHVGVAITKMERSDSIRAYELPESAPSDNLGVLAALYSVPTVVIALVLLSIWPDVQLFGDFMRGK